MDTVCLSVKTILLLNQIQCFQNASKREYVCKVLLLNVFTRRKSKTVLVNLIAIQHSLQVSRQDGMLMLQLMLLPHRLKERWNQKRGEAMKIRAAQSNQAQVKPKTTQRNVDFTMFIQMIQKMKNLYAGPKIQESQSQIRMVM